MKLLKWQQESLEAKIERWKGQSALPPRPPTRPAATRARLEWAPPQSAPPVTNDLLLDLPRICAVTRKLWCARYLRQPGEQSFRYIRSTVPESRLCIVEYIPERRRALPPEFVAGIEDCPHCGGYTMDGYTGAVFDPACQLWCCFGLTSRDGWFICQCGNEGRLDDFTGKRYGMR